MRDFNVSWCGHGRCPFWSADEGAEHCGAKDMSEGGRKLATMEDTPPDWCPLRQGAVTVRLADAT